jgi:hypothetical protein
VQRVVQMDEKKEIRLVEMKVVKVVDKLAESSVEVKVILLVNERVDKMGYESVERMV